MELPKGYVKYAYLNIKIWNFILHGIYIFSILKYIFLGVILVEKFSCAE